jgi:hypothetical protein
MDETHEYALMNPAEVMPKLVPIVERNLKTSEEK